MKINKKPFVLALVVAAGIAAVATTRVRASADTQLLALMPPDSKILLGARVDQGVVSPVGQFILAKIPSGALDDIKTKTGLDVRTDLREVVVSPVAKLGAVSGLFPVSRLEDLLKQGNHAVDTYRGIRTVGDAKECVAFLNGTTLLVGSPEAVHQAIDRWMANAQPPANDLMAKVALASATSHAWFAATDLSALQAQLGPQQNQETTIVANILQKIGSVSGQLTLPPAGGVSVQGQLQATSPQDAQTLYDAYQALKLLAPTEASNNPLFNLPQVNVNGSALNFTLALTQQQVETTLH